MHGERIDELVKRLQASLDGCLPVELDKDEVEFILSVIYCSDGAKSQEA